jgi:Cd2+/Zn2+-exporting ATPase
MEFKATRTAEDTTVARIVAMVEDAQSKRAKSQRLVDAFARYWTPGMILLSLAVALFVPLAFGQPFHPWVYRGLTALIVACPCSLVISTPVTVVAAIARAARFGVLIKGGIHLEDLGKVKAVAFDKTGTITKGRIAVERVVTAKSAEVGPDDILAAAAAVESRSEHPLAKAVLSHAREKGLEFDAGEHFATIRGRGAKARVNGRTVYVGSPRLFSDMNVEIPPDLLSAAAEMRDDGQTAVFVGNSTDVLGVIGLADEVREESKDALGRLAGRGLQVVMLTGDEEATARAVAMRTGISSYKAGLLPGGKQEAIAALRAEYGTVAMVGDGVNDAPSLASSDVGIAMGAGADVALETADVALLTNDLCRIPWSIGLGRAARRLIAENVGFSVIIKVAALAFVMAGRLPLWAAVLADSGASVLVTLNGLRILGYK